MRSTYLYVFAVFAWNLWIPATSAKVVAVDVQVKEDIPGGRAFGGVGTYEKLAGRIYFEFEPTNPMNARIVDLDKAPVNDAGRVEDKLYGSKTKEVMQGRLRWAVGGQQPR